MPERYGRMGEDTRTARVARIRHLMGVTQAAFANEIGMSVRAYSDIENKLSTCKVTHVLAAERALLAWAANVARPELLEDEEVARLLSDVMNVAVPRLEKAGWRRPDDAAQDAA